MSTFHRLEVSDASTLTVSALLSCPALTHLLHLHFMRLCWFMQHPVYIVCSYHTPIHQTSLPIWLHVPCCDTHCLTHSVLGLDLMQAKPLTDTLKILDPQWTNVIIPGSYQRWNRYVRIDQSAVWVGASLRHLPFFDGGRPGAMLKAMSCKALPHKYLYWYRVCERSIAIESYGAA